MCKISNKLKLCGCQGVDRKKTKHYWVFSRYKEADDWMEGMIMPPVNLPEDIERFNVALLEAQLNSGSCFDFEIDPEEKDTLELHFSELFKPDDYLVYFFRYIEGRWQPRLYDVFDSTREMISEGYIEQAFEDYDRSESR